MNRLFLLVCLLSISINLLWSQSVPLKFNYQVSLRDNNGEPISDRKVSFRIHILNSSPSGAILYQEEHKGIQTLSGIGGLVIGSGSNTSGSLSAIQDLSKSYYLKVEFDPNNGSSYSEISSTQLISVPYAITANTLAQNGATNGKVLKWDGTNKMWIPATDDIGSGTGGITRIETGPGLIGGPINTSTQTIDIKQPAGVAGSYGSSSKIPRIEVNTYGQITSVSEKNISSGSGGTVTNISTGTGLMGGPITDSGTIYLSNVLAKDQVGTYGNASVVPQLTVNQQGQITNITTVPIATSGGSQLFTLGSSNAYYNSGNNKFVISNNDNYKAPLDFSNSSLTYPSLQLRNFDRFAILGFEFTGNPIICIGHGNAKYAGMRRDPGTQKYDLFAETKSFVIQHPAFSDSVITYTCIEGPEAAAYERGSGKLINGIARINFKDYFTLIINPNTITINVTPYSLESKGLAIISKDEFGFEVGELHNGKGNYNFDWEVKAVRKGFENNKVIRHISEYQINNSSNK